MAKSEKAPKMSGLTASKTKAASKSSKSKTKATAPVTDTNDVLVGTSTEVENLSKSKALKMAPELIDATGANDFKLGGVLAKIQEEGWWEGGDYESFKAYVEGVLGLQYRKSMYLINIYDKLVDAGVSWSDVAGIGWSKLRFIVNHLTAKNAGKWAKRCAKMNALEIQDYVKQLEAGKSSGKGDESEPTVTSVSTMSFKVHEDQKEIIREALDKKKGDLDTEHDAVALENLALDYVQGTTGKSKKVTKGQVVKFLTDLGEEDAAEMLLKIYPSLGEE